MRLEPPGQGGFRSVSFYGSDAMFEVVCDAKQNGVARPGICDRPQKRV